MHVSCDRSPGEEHWVPCGTDALGACDAPGSAPEFPRSEDGEEGPFLSPMLLVRSSRDRVGGGVVLWPWPLSSMLAWTVCSNEGFGHWRLLT